MSNVRKFTSFCTRTLQAACAAEWLQHLAPRAISRSWSIGKWLTQNSSFLHGSTWHLWIACPEGLHRWVHDSDAPHTRWCACCGFLSFFFFCVCINAARKQSRLYGYVPCLHQCSYVNVPDRMFVTIHLFRRCNRTLVLAGFGCSADFLTYHLSVCLLCMSFCAQTPCGPFVPLQPLHRCLPTLHRRC